MMPDALQRALDTAEHLQQLGRWQEAERHLAIQMRDHPGRWEPLRALAILHSRTRRPEHAIALMQAAVERAPAQAQLHCELGRMLGAAGRIDESIVAFAASTRQAPHWAEAWYFLGVTLERAARDGEALDALRTALQLAPQDRRMLDALARIEFRIGEPEDALPLWLRLCELEPECADHWLKCGECLTRDGRHDEARAMFERALERMPDSPDLWLGLAQAEEDAGARASAEKAYRRALALRPGWPHALGGLLDLTRDEHAPALVDQAAELLRSDTLDDAGRAVLGYGLGKVHDRRRDYAAALSSWRDANTARRRVCGPFDRDAMRRWAEAALENYTRPDLPGSGAAFAVNERPVFVVGMPRSGTTLVEQILASHPEVSGCGELPDMARNALRIQDRVRPGACPKASLSELFATLAQRYLAKLDRIGGQASLRAVDKLPLNFFHLGLVHALFPRARVLWCRRQPRDVALSIYSENFALDSRFATDIQDILWLHDLHLDIMQRWRDALDLRVLEVDYEALVAEPEAGIRRLIDFLGLPWDEACLAFHAASRNVQTPSRWQVRQPIYSGSISRWRHYAALFETG